MDILLFLLKNSQSYRVKMDDGVCIVHMREKRKEFSHIKGLKVICKYEGMMNRGKVDKCLYIKGLREILGENRENQGKTR